MSTPNPGEGDPPNPTGVERIERERAHQIDIGWSGDHDDCHADGELLQAAALYLQAALIVERAPEEQAIVCAVMGRLDETSPAFAALNRMIRNPARYHFGWDRVPDAWPWEDSWKPSPTAVRNLEKAGALIAAEIDRLEATPQRSTPVLDTLIDEMDAAAAEVTAAFVRHVDDKDEGKPA